MIEVRVDAAAFVRWLAEADHAFQADARQALGQSVQYALALARADKSFKDRTGKLRGSLSAGMKGPWKGFLKASAEHALFVEEDTKAHRIEARNAKALRFVQHGEVRFRRSVWHPGTKGTHFLQRAADQAGAKLEELLEKAADRSFR